jgi:hypothetical protein
MGVRITEDEQKVALFDSVSGLAFGPVFDSSNDATYFLTWLAHKEKQGSTFKFGFDNIRFLADPRIYRFNELMEVVRIFREEYPAN